MVTVGVLALQGDVREHLRMLERCGAAARPVRRAGELAAVDGLIIPGGESTTMIKLADAFELSGPLRVRVADGLPVMGTCAGMIMLADRIEDGIQGQHTIGGIDMVVRRNAFGRQVDSFEAELEVDGLDSGFHAVFIRAPRVDQVGPSAEVIARIRTSSELNSRTGQRRTGQPGHSAAGTIVAVRQGRLLATSFHPELTGDTRIHDHFVRLVKEA